MGVVVVVPGQAEPWMVSNKAFDLLIHEALPLITRPEDRQTLLRAQANGGLFIDHHDLVDQRRIAEPLAAAAHHLRRRLMDDPWSGAWEKSLITHLPVLEMWMEGNRVRRPQRGVLILLEITRALRGKVGRDCLTLSTEPQG